MFVVKFKLKDDVWDGPLRFSEIITLSRRHENKADAWATISHMKEYFTDEYFWVEEE